MIFQIKAMRLDWHPKRVIKTINHLCINNSKRVEEVAVTC